MDRKQNDWEESTQYLLLLVGWYFGAYVLTGVIPKIFTKGLLGIGKITQMENLFYSTIGGVVICLAVVLWRGWLKRFKPSGHVKVAGVSVARELLWLVPSGICTAIIIPGTTMMYTFGVSVMVAISIMRGCIIVIGRAVDAIQIRQGILKKKVFWEEDVAVMIAIAAVMTLMYGGGAVKPGEKPPESLTSSAAAMVTLTLYVAAYAVRIYIMNHYKNTQRAPDNKAFFAVEQVVAVVALVITVGLVLMSDSSDFRVVEMKRAASDLNWLAILGGVPFGLAAFPSVFLFMFKGRTGTFTALLNRVTSLIAGTAATLLLIPLGQPEPASKDWAALGLLLVASGFLAKAEKRRRMKAVAL